MLGLVLYARDWLEDRLDRKEPVAINTVVTHKRPHLDELWAIALFTWFGEMFFPGIRNATRRYEGKPKNVDGLERLTHGELCVGVGRHIFDEHPKPNDMKCCANLVRDYLDKAFGNAREVIRKITAQVRYLDRTSNAHTFALSSLIKEWWQLHEGEDEYVLDRAKRLLQAIYNYELGKIEKQPATFALSSLANAIEEECRDEGTLKVPGVQSYLKYLREFRLDDKQVRMMDIGYVFYAMMMTKHRSLQSRVFAVAKSISRDVVRSALEYHEQDLILTPQLKRRFLKNLSDEAAKLLGVAERKVHLISLQTDDRHWAKIARRRGGDITVIGNSRRHIQVFTKKEKNKHGHGKPFTSLAPFVGKWRKEDMVARGLSVPDKPDSYWEQAGEIPESPIYYQQTETGESAYLGTNQGYDEAPPSPLSRLRVSVLAIAYVTIMPSEIFHAPLIDLVEPGNPYTQYDDPEELNTEEDGSSATIH